MMVNYAYRYSSYYLILLIFSKTCIQISYSFSARPTSADKSYPSVKTIMSDQAEEERKPTTRRRYYSPFLSPQHCDSGNSKQQHSSAALIVLNTPIQTTANRSLPDVFRVLWESTTFHVCADGGANRLYDATTLSSNLNDDIREDGILIPDLITGDLDSIRPDVRSYYEERGVPIVCVEDQNYHDLDKSLMAVEKWIEKKKLMPLPSSSSNRNDDGGCNGCGEETNVCPASMQTFIYGGFGGRFDQEMACINTLYSWGRKASFQHTQMAIFDEETGVILLPEAPITNEITIRFPDIEGVDENESIEKCDQMVVGEGPTCGLIPIGGRCERVHTTGLKWNLSGDMPLEFGGLVSSSNRVVDKVVTVKTSSPLLFSFEIVKR